MWVCVYAIRVKQAANAPARHAVKTSTSSGKCGVYESLVQTKFVSLHSVYYDWNSCNEIFTVVIPLNLVNNTHFDIACALALSLLRFLSRPRANPFRFLNLWLVSVSVWSSALQTDFVQSIARVARVCDREFMLPDDLSSQGQTWSDALALVMRHFIGWPAALFMQCARLIVCLTRTKQRVIQLHHCLHAKNNNDTIVARIM